MVTPTFLSYCLPSASLCLQGAALSLESLGCTKTMLACLPDISHHIPAAWVWTALYGILRTYPCLGTVQRGRGGVPACQLKCRKGQRDRKIRGVPRWRLEEPLIPQLCEEHSNSSPSLCCVSGVLEGTLALPEAVYSPLGPPSCLSFSPAPFSSVLTYSIFIAWNWSPTPLRPFLLILWRLF